MTTPSAWTIQAAMAAAQSALSRLQATGDVDMDEAAALTVLAEEAPDIDVVLVRLLRAMGEANATVEALEQRVLDLHARKARYSSQRDEYRRTVFAILDALGVRKWKSAEFTVSVTDGRPGVVITDESALPDAFVRVERTPNKTAIKEAMERGEVVPGAEMTNGFAQMTVRTK